MRYAFSTGRVGLRQPTDDDAPWLYTLNNDPLWERFIGNRGVHTLRGAKRYVMMTQNHFRQWGYGLWVMEQRLDGKPMGLCGLVNRGIFNAPDLGFALLEKYRGKGFVCEASEAVLEQARVRYRFKAISALAHVQNTASCNVLNRLGFVRYGQICIPGMARQQLFWRELK